VSLYCKLVARRHFFICFSTAWERYVAEAKWTERKAIVTTGRLNKYKRVAWLLAVLTVVPLVTKVAVSVCYEIVVCLHITCSLCPGLSRSSKLQPNVIDLAQLVINYAQRKA